MGTIIEVLLYDTRFSSILTAFKSVGFVDILNGSGPFTIFAPTNAAFAKVDPQTINAVFTNKQKLSAVVKYHAIVGKTVPVNIEMIHRTNQNGNTIVDESNLKCSNGLIHIVETLYVP